MIEPEWGDFKLMLALSRGGSIAGAARILCIDSSTVSRRLAALELAVGACLVVRGGREFSLTVEGKAAVAAAEAIEGIVTAATASIRAAHTGIEGVVRVTVVPSMLRTLMPLLGIASERYPGLSIELNAAMRMYDLAKGEADIAIRMTQPREIDLVGKRAFEMGFGAYAAKSYVARCGKPATQQELAQHRLVQYAEPMLHLPWFAWIEQYASKGAPATRVDGTEMALGVICAGTGIGVLPFFTGEGAPDLVRIFPEPIACAIGWIVYHESSRKSARVRAVVDMLSEFFDSRGSELSGKQPCPQDDLRRSTGKLP